MSAAAGTPVPVFELVPGEADHPELAHWRANVGASVALDLAPRVPGPILGVDVLCWNLWIGRGRLAELLGRLRDGEFGGAGSDPARPLVILAQEVYRADETVPASAASGFHGGGVGGADRLDIVHFAREQGLSLRYSPSMRNGAARSDRGNAILSTAALDRAHAFALPYVRQHRVAVAAELVGLPGLAFVSAHLDTRGAPRSGPRSLRFGSGRAAQAAELARRLVAADGPGGVVVGADLNTPLGVRDPAVRRLVQAGFTPGSRAGRWEHTFHGPGGVRFHLDHLLYFSADGALASLEVARLDEHPRDAGPRIFGSDHHPLLARVVLRGGHT